MVIVAGGCESRTKNLTPRLQRDIKPLNHVIHNAVNKKLSVSDAMIRFVECLFNWGTLKFLRSHIEVPTVI